MCLCMYACVRVSMRAQQWKAECSQPFRSSPHAAEIMSSRYTLSMLKHLFEHKLDLPMHIPRQEAAKNAVKMRLCSGPERALNLRIVS